MNTVLSIIIMLRLNSLNIDNNYMIADYIIGHLSEMKNKSIKQLSKDTFVSTTAILKFCNLIGFDTYSKFKNALSSTIETRKLQLLEKNKLLNPEEILNYIDSFASKKIDQDVFKNQIDQVVLKIKEYKAIHFYGATFPLALTTSFIEDMALLGIYVNTHQDNYEIRKIENHLGVHIMVTLSGRYVEANRNSYIQITSLDYPSVIISKNVINMNDINYCIQLPETKSSQYDEVVLLLLVDYILLQFLNN